MQQSILKVYVLSFALLSLINAGSAQQETSLSPAQRAKQVRQDNEFQRSEAGRDLVIHLSPIRLDGQPLDYSQFSIHSQGELTVVVGDPDTEGARKIPFQVFIRRNEEVVKDFASGFTGEARMSMDLGQVLAHSQPGDQLIIQPYWKEHWKAKRILKILESAPDGVVLGC